MADFEKAYKFMIPNEVFRYGDPRCIFYSNDPDDAGGATAWGITEEVARKHGYTGDMIDLPEATAKHIYREGYWRFEGITDQRVAAKLFDMSVNMGPRQATLLAQGVAGATPDGKYGPRTEAALNALPPAVALNNLSIAQTNFYHGLIRKKPSNQKFLTGWLRRARKIPEA